MPFVSNFQLPVTGGVATAEGLEGALNTEMQRLYNAAAADTTAAFPSRTAAAAAVANLHSAVASILVLNGGNLEWRSRWATGPDPLVGTEWGVVQTVPSLSLIHI